MFLGFDHRPTGLVPANDNDFIAVAPVQSDTFAVTFENGQCVVYDEDCYAPVYAVAY